ncbi:hypothetical protein Bbelb_051330 [Branchiostoma belcheri]|nr:hypothetical protein Bbelb_051330 [Branchiostoma belcheri]
MPERMSDAFVDLPWKRLGLGLPRLRHLYRQGLVTRFARLIGLPVSDKAPNKPLAHFTRPALLRQLQSYLKSGVKKDPQSPIGVVTLPLKTTGESMVVKTDKRQREQSWFSHMLGAMADGKIGMQATADECALTLGTPKLNNRNRLENEIKTITALESKLTREKEERLTDLQLIGHPLAARLIASAAEHHTSIARTLGPLTTFAQWNWARVAYSRYIHKATFKVTAPECGSYKQINGTSQWPDQEHYVAGCAGTIDLQTLRHHAVCNVLLRMCTRKGYVAERETWPVYRWRRKRVFLQPTPRRGRSERRVRMIRPRIPAATAQPRQQQQNAPPAAAQHQAALVPPPPLPRQPQLPAQHPVPQAQPPPPAQPPAPPAQPPAPPAQPAVVPVQPAGVPVQPPVVPAQPAGVPAQPPAPPVQPPSSTGPQGLQEKMTENVAGLDCEELCVFLRENPTELKKKRRTKKRYAGRSKEHGWCIKEGTFTSTMPYSSRLCGGQGKKPGRPVIRITQRWLSATPYTSCLIATVNGVQGQATGQTQRRRYHNVHGVVKGTSRNTRKTFECLFPGPNEEE